MPMPPPFSRWQISLAMELSKFPLKIEPRFFSEPVKSTKAIERINHNATIILDKILRSPAMISPGATGYSPVANGSDSGLTTQQSVALDILRTCTLYPPLSADPDAPVAEATCAYDQSLMDIALGVIVALFEGV